MLCSFVLLRCLFLLCDVVSICGVSCSTSFLCTHLLQWPSSCFCCAAIWLVRISIQCWHLLSSMAETNVPLCVCDCGLFMSDETASISSLHVGWTHCECRICGTNQACTVPCSEILGYSTALTRGKLHEFTQACRLFRCVSDYSEDFKASHRKFCGSCIDHGLLQFSVEAVSPSVDLASMAVSPAGSLVSMAYVDNSLIRKRPAAAMLKRPDRYSSSSTDDENSSMVPMSPPLPVPTQQMPEATVAPMLPSSKAKAYSRARQALQLDMTPSSSSWCVPE